MKNVKHIFLTGLIFASPILGGMVLMPSTVSAAVDPACDKSSSFLGLPTWYKYLKVDKVNGNCEIVMPEKVPPPTHGSKIDVGAAASRVLLAVFEIILRIGGILAVVFVVWGGIQYQLAQGEPERLGNARSVIINSLIGLAIAVSSTAIVNLVANNVL